MSKINVVYPVTSCLYPFIQPTNYFGWDDCSLFRYSNAAHFVCYLLSLLLLQASFSLEILVALLLELPTALLFAVVSLCTCLLQHRLVSAGMSGFTYTPIALCAFSYSSLPVVVTPADLRTKWPKWSI
jgi:hypothetical protein